MNSQQRHPDRESLLRFVSDKLDEQQASEISGHIDGCQACQQSLETLVESNSYIAKTLRNTEPNSLSFRHDDNLLIIEEIASGGMGVIYRGYDRELKREVAIKVSRDGDRKSREIRFYREAQISSQLQHPGVVPVYRVGRLVDGRQFIAMKVVDGQTLTRKIIDHHSESTKATVSLSRLLDVFQQVCQTIAYAHSRGVIHRDLKPENIMVGAYGEVQVMDWGLAKRIDGENEQTFDFPLEKKLETKQSENKQTDSKYKTVLGAAIGTPAYMPPEQAIGANVDRRADVFALGGILCEILTGAPPFGDSAKTIALEKASECDIGAVHSRLDQCKCDADIIQLAKVCLSPLPDDRPNDAGTVSNRLLEIVVRNEGRLREAELNQARSVERLVAEKKRRKQLFWSAASIVGVLMLTAAATIMFLYERNVRQDEQHARRLDAVQQRLADERELRKIVGRANERINAALLATDLQKSEKWEIAKTEIAHAKELASRIESEALLAEYESITNKIDFGTADAISRDRQIMLADQLQQAVEYAVQVSKYPRELLWSGSKLQTLNRLDLAFNELGVQKFMAVEQAVEALQIIDDRDLLLQAFFWWQTQSLNNITAAQRGSQEHNRIRSWFFELSTAIDPDSFRNELRVFYDDHQALIIMMGDQGTTSSPLTCYWVSQALQDADLPALREDFLNRAHVKHPDDVELNWQLSKIHAVWENGREGCENGLRHMQFCYAAEPDNIGVVTKLAEMYHRLNESKLAFEFGQRLVGLAPDYDYANALMAMIYLDNGGGQELAIKYARKALEINPRMQQPYLTISRVHLNRGDIEKAIEVADQLDEIYPNHFVVHRRHADIYMRSGRFGEALESILKAKKLAPSDYWTVRLLGEIYQLNEKWFESIEVYEQLIEKFPEEPLFCINQAKAYLKTGKPKLAENVLRQVSRDRKNTEEIHKLINEALAGQGKPEEPNSL